jgi:hypothetical protein
VSGSPALGIEERPAWRQRAAARLPWWAWLLLIYAGSRVVTTLLFLAVGAGASSASRVGAHPSLLTMLTAWDGQWYWLIGESGYPTALPRTDAGDIDTNQWAFLPVYPLLVKALAVLCGLPWPPVAVVVSIVAGGAAAVLLGLLLRPHIGAPRAAFAVAVFCLSPLAFVLQMAYAEALGLCLTLGALILVDRHRYLAAVPVSVVLAFTRPGVLALALAVTLQLALRLLRARRGRPAVPTRELVGGLVLAGVATVAGFAWSAVAGIMTGVSDAYFETELAWRALWMGRSEFAFFTPWFFAGDFWFGRTLRGTGRGGPRRGRVRRAPLHPGRAPARRDEPPLARLLRALPVRRVLPAVERVPAAHAHGSARRRRGSEGPRDPGRGADRLRRAPGAVALVRRRATAGVLECALIRESEPAHLGAARSCMR